jgi:peptide deformylase
MFSLGMRMESLCVEGGFPGLSAPQVGIGWNFFVCWDNYPSTPASFLYLFDCEYEGSGQRMLSLEGCASFQGRRFGIMRFPSIRLVSKIVSADESGKISISRFERVFSGITAAVVQHEMDHIRGIPPDTAGEEIYTR